MKLTGKRCWIVGATGAIGSVVAQKFLEEDAVVLTDRVDVLHALKIEKLIEYLQPDILINCSGILGSVGPVHKTSTYSWRRVIEVNLIGSYNLTQAVLPRMIQNKAGKIIHFSGGGAAYGRPFYSAYAASKAGLVRFVESVAEEVEPFNIQINTIAPGAVKSKMNPEAVGTADSAAALAVFLASDESGNVTGRLISALHDRWSVNIDGLSEEAGKLRRIPFTNA
ncbi:MAG: SDR family NAD(P)-dependent oxidoreductase [Thaumarchaeota archaeon]|nr:SDR family NAD(P)-dependent oxidoreductase [Nitrososphaerota archaeon]